MTAQEKTKLIERYRGKSLADLNPDLAKEWHPTKNGNLTPNMVAPHSSKKVWWLLLHYDAKTGKRFDFEWTTTINSRSHGMNCPYLSGYAIWPGFNDLATVNPDLAKEWHPTKNGDLTPEMVMPGTYKKVWWYLPYDDPKTGKHFDFEWEAPIPSRAIGGYGCPFFSGRAIWRGYNDLATINPKLAKQWHPTKNGTLTPQDVTISTTRRVWWLLSYDDPQTGKHFDFEWEAPIGHRARGSGCPYLLARKLWRGYNDLESANPQFIKEWHPTKNGTLTPRDVTSTAKQKVWWLCPNGHEWKTGVHVRKMGANCPICRLSKGELAVSSVLEKNNICFVPQYRFENCKHKIKLPFDFAVFDNAGCLSFLIEYDGLQHEIPVSFGKSCDAEKKLVDTKYRDGLKNEYCRKNKIPLVRISYKDYDNIEKILLKKMVRYGLM